MTPPDIMRAVGQVTRALELLNIPYYIGGSIASSVHGVARATLDVDLVARIELRHISSLMEELQRDFYIDAGMTAEAVNRRSSFNLIHLETSIKVDVFVPKDELYQQTAMDRKIRDTLIEGDPNSEFYISSAEDIILNKLIWYMQGERVSERQWLDVTGVIKVQGDSLDRVYLERWAEDLQVSALLKKAFKDAGLQPRLR